MKYSIGIFAMAMALSACQPKNTAVSPSQTPTEMVKLVHDPHSYSIPNDARVLHLNWNASVDFSTKIISATAEYQIANLNKATKIVFDTKGLNVQSASVDGQNVAFEVGNSDAILGAPLTIPILENSKVVSITYTTSPDAEALLWVEGEKPFLFTQSQAILGRTWVPCQDSPGVRFTYDAKVKVPSDLMALMSAENPQQKNPSGEYSFKMDQPIPAYLMALAVGDVEFRNIGKQTGVYAVPSLIDAAAKEFEDMQKMVDAAEALYGPYIWGRYDVLVLPAAFPFGGMENPKLTFATPTIIAGDKSLVSLIAHELAHSWSGNLVTNATWNDFWLNEGFTVYFEERIMEAVYGREYSEMLAQLSRQELDETIADLSASEHPEDTHLKLALEGRSPDDGMTDIAYNKGYFFLRLCEETVGREKWDAFIKKYFTEHSLQVMDTEAFVVYLKENFKNDGLAEKVNFDEWIYKPGLPASVPTVQSDRMTRVTELAAEYSGKHLSTAQIPWQGWSYQERVHFINNLKDTDEGQMIILDKAFDISITGNNEVLFAWLKLAIKSHYTEAYDELEMFLGAVGRRKFVAPLFEELVKTNQQDLAKKIYAKSRSHYHAVTIGTVDEILQWNK